MIFENAEPQWRFSVRGTCFLIIQENQTFALTAKHVVETYRPSQYRIPYHLGSHDMLPIRQPFTPDFYSGENFEEVDFEDFVVIPIDTAEITGSGFDPGEACLIHESPIRWSTIGRIGVFGFPADLNLVDYDQGLISIQACGMVGRLTGESVGEGMREIRFEGSGDLTTYDGFSGSPVFEVSQSGNPQRLLGIILRGSQNTSASRLGHFLDVRVVPALIRQYFEYEASDRTDASG